MAELKLVSSHDEVGNVRTFIFETGGATWLAGQYQTYVLRQAGDNKDDNQRFFTIAAAPSEGEIHISTRVTESKFKQALNALHPGDTVEAHGIEGDFTWEDVSDTPVVLVAGGIGVTPYRSMLLERHAQGKPLSATLVYFTRDDAIPFRAEFDSLVAQHPELKIDYVIGEAISADSILQHAPQTQSQVTYLSGPEAMVDSVGEDLQKRGVNLKQDWFPGYDATSY